MRKRATVEQLMARRNGKGTNNAVPYYLTYSEQLDAICARGSVEVMNQLSMCIGARRCASRSGEYITLPASRLYFMVAEAITNPDAVHQSYIDKRKQLMSLTPEQDAEVDTWIEYIGMNQLKEKNFELMQHQREFVYFAARLPNVFNGSEQGTGKTLCGLISLYMRQLKRVLIVCKPSLMQEWRNEHIMRFEHNADQYERFQFHPLHTIPVAERMKYIYNLNTSKGRHIILVNYEVVAKMLDALMFFNPEHIIFDESQALKGPTSKRTIAATQLAKSVSRPFVFEQTGTPLCNHVGDLFSQLNILIPNFPFVKQDAFLARFALQEPVKGPGGRPLMYGGVAKMAVTGCSDTAGLMSLIEPIWFRAPKAVCLDLPPKVYHPPVMLKMSEEQRKLYNDVKEDGEQALGRIYSLSSAAITQLRQRQITGGHAAIFTLADIDDPSTETKEVVELNCPKIDWLRDWVQDHMADNNHMRIIVWCVYNAEVYRITRELREILSNGAVAFINGTVNNETTITAIKQSFNSRNPDGIRVLVCQIDKMYEGHNLQAADVNIYFSNSFSYMKRAQSEDRSHRKGRNEAVQYIDLICEGTVDVDIFTALMQKQDFAAKVTPGTISGGKETNNE